MTVLIAGGGIGGLCMAIALSQRGISSHIFEQADEFSKIGAGIQIGPNGMRLLDHWGLSELLEGKGATPSSVRICDGILGTKLNHVPLGAFAFSRYGAPYKVFHRAELQLALTQKARSLSDISMSMGFEAKKFTETKNHITLHSKSGKTHTGRLLVGADGLWSTVRNQLYPNRTPVFYGKSAWRAIIPRKEAPAPFNREQTGLWMAPNAHLVHYPIQNGDAINVVAVIHEDIYEPDWNSPGQKQRLISQFAGWHQTPLDFLANIPSWQKWALFRLNEIPGWSRGRVTLMGDAAHPPVPFLAQGGAMAMEDAFVLARELQRHGDDFKSAFTHYETQRRKRTCRVMSTAHKLGKIYHMGGVMRLARNIVLTRKNPENLLAAYDWLYGFVLDTSS